MENLEEKIIRLLKDRQVDKVGQAGYRPAAVMVLFFFREGDYHFIFTKRSDELPQHKGEISFPGGAKDPEDADFLAAALRECEEELGIKREDIRVLGRLDDIVSVSNFSISPFVGAISASYPYRICRGEVQEVVEVPLTRLMDHKFQEESTLEYKGRSIPVYYFYYNDHTIWGATARILKQLLDLLRENP